MRRYEFQIGLWLALAGAHGVFRVGMGTGRGTAAMEDLCWLGVHWFLPVNMWIMISGAMLAASAWASYSLGRRWGASFTVTGLAAIAGLITIASHSLSYGALIATGCMFAVMHTAFGKSANV